MQFDLADRIIRQFTQEGETVFDPFMGIGTVPARAIKLKRKGYGIELSHGYYLDAVMYCKAAEQKANMPGLFDFLEVEEIGTGNHRMSDDELRVMGEQDRAKELALETRPK
jgi:DNA modification methylase